MIEPNECPTPMYHDTHYYCPSCSFVAEDAPVSEAEAQRGRADLLHAELGEALAKNAELKARLQRQQAVIEAAHVLREAGQYGRVGAEAAEHRLFLALATLIKESRPTPERTEPT
jgi:hypothetical protein